MLFRTAVTLFFVSPSKTYYRIVAVIAMHHLRAPCAHIQNWQTQFPIVKVAINARKKEETQYDRHAT